MHPIQLQIEGPSGLRSDVIEWFSAISAGNMGQVVEMLKANKELLVERDENQVRCSVDNSFLF